MFFKIKTATLVLLISLTVFSGCVTAGFHGEKAKPDTGYAVLQVYGPWTFTETGSSKAISIPVGISTPDYNAVIPAGEYKIRTYDNKSYTVSEKIIRNAVGDPIREETKYIPYTEIWQTTYTFERGKIYEVYETNKAVLSYSDGILSTSTPGVIIQNEFGKNVTVTHPDSDIMIKQESRKLLGNTYIGLYSGFGLDAEVKSKPLSIGPLFSPRAGMMVMNRNFGVILAGKAGAGFSGGTGIGLNLAYGGLMEIHFSHFGLGFEGGWANGFYYPFIGLEKDADGN
jgi:hypothetical protein